MATKNIVSAIYTATPDDTVINCNATNTNIVITMFGARDYKDHSITFKKTDTTTNTIRIDDTHMLKDYNDYITLTSDGEAWILSDKNNNSNRKFRPKLGCSPYYVYASEDDVLSDLETLDSIGFESISFVCHIVDDDDELVNTEKDLFIPAYNKQISLGREISSIKFHCSDATRTGYADDWEVDYKALVVEMCVLAQGKVDKFIVLNEHPEVLYNAGSQAFVIDLLQTIAGYGFDVGVSISAGSEGLGEYPDNTWLDAYVDHFYLNTYVEGGYKEEKTTLQDQINTFNISKDIELIKEHSDLPIIISETGVQDYYEALSKPSSYDWDEPPISATATNGKAPYIYLYGLFNSKFAQECDEVWIWYPDQLNHSIVRNLIKDYTGGTHYARS